VSFRTHKAPSRLIWTLNRPWRRLPGAMMKMTKRMKLVPRWAPAALACCAALAGAAAAAAPKPYVISGALLNADKKWEAREVMGRQVAGVDFEMKYLDPAATRAAISRGLGREVDLLPGKVDEGRVGYLVFLAQVVNNSKTEVIFNPNMARMITDKGDYKIALDYSGIYEAANRLGPQAPSLDELAALFFDRSMSLKPGGSARKLLAFVAPTEDRFKQLEVIFAEITFGDKPMDVAFTFRKFLQEDK